MKFSTTGLNAVKGLFCLLVLIGLGMNESYIHSSAPSINSKNQSHIEKESKRTLYGIDLFNNSISNYCPLTSNLTIAE